MSKRQRYFTKDLDKAPHEKMFNIIAIKEMQVKTIIRYHSTPVRVTNMSNRYHTKSW